MKESDCGTLETGRQVSPFHRNLATGLAMILVVFFASGCGVTLDPVKRKPLQIVPMEASLTSSPKTAVVHFESSIPGRPLDETVWDNVSGPFWDVRESKQIGYTQDYSKFVPVVFASGVLAGPVGGAVVGVAAGPQLVDTRIVIPFGRIFEDVFQSGLRSAFPNASIASDDSSTKTAENASQYLLNIKVVEFYVWEQPLNHINLQTTVRTKIYRANQTNDVEFAFESHCQTTNQPLGTMMSTSSGFIKEMNKISNRFAADLSTQILQTLRAKMSR